MSTATETALDAGIARQLAAQAFACQATGHRIGLELEWHVYDPNDHTRRLPPAEVHDVVTRLGPLAPGVTTSVEPGLMADWYLGRANGRAVVAATGERSVREIEVGVCSEVRVEAVIGIDRVSVIPSFVVGLEVELEDPAAPRPAHRRAPVRAGPSAAGAGARPRQ